LSQKLQVSEVPIAYNLSFDSQFSKQKLYSNDQFSVGGIYSVRGFKEGVISGDSGYNIKNEFSANLGKIFAPFLSEKNSQCLTKLNHFSVAPFYDYGHIQLKAGQGSGRLSGAGFKFGFDGKNFDASIVFSWAVSKSQFLGAQNLRENSAVFFNLSSEVGFF
jgi:hemolysin activation/secretion protein